MFKRIFIFCVFLFTAVVSLKAQNEVLFTPAMLNDPKKYSKEIEKAFKIQITKKVNPKAIKNAVALPNGYALFEIKNAEPWYDIKDQVTAKEVSLVFSKYPKDINFWQTNYYELLANRLKNLFDIDPELNNKNIKFFMVLETECETEEDAKKLFHGFLIKYDKLTPAQIKAREAEKQKQASAGKADLSSARSRVTRYMKNAGGMLDSSVYKALDRNKHWDTALVVVDWTSSMYQYSAQCMAWHLDHVDTSGLQYFAFFNDGDAKYENEKEIGVTGGIYYGTSDNMNQVVKVFSLAMRKGLGGEMPENDVEAIVKSMEHFPNFKDLILIADNSLIRDFDLWDQIKHPVRVILADGDWTVNPQYINLAYLTGGSFHTRDGDWQFGEGFNDTLLTISGMEFVLDPVLNLFVCRDKEKCRYMDQELAAREKKNLEELQQKSIYRTMHKDKTRRKGFFPWLRRLFGANA